MYRPGRSFAGPSKASATTVCQKCLQKGHYSYECTVPAAKRPYASRPSRSQQLLNPSLAPKLADAAPNPLLKKEGVADAQLAKLAKERGQRDENGRLTRGRSASSSSSASVSTISTTLSESRSPPRRKRQTSEGKASSDRDRRRASRERTTSESRSDRFVPVNVPRPSKDTGGGESRRKKSPRGPSQSPVRRRSPPARITRVKRRSRSPSSSPDRRASRRDRSRSPINKTELEERPPPQENRARMRSLSPFSKRLALTQAMNM